MTISAFAKGSVLAVGIAVGLTGFSSSNPAQAAIINGSFSNNLNGWQTIGNASIGSLDGSSAAQLVAGSSQSTSIESFLGLTSGQLTPLSNGSSLFSGSAIKQVFFANAGDIVKFTWNFKADDYLPYNDFAFTSLSSAVSSSVSTLANVLSVGNYGTSGAKTFTYNIATTGTYTLGFGVFNVGDNGWSSQLAVDNVSQVPTPALLPGLVGLGLGVLRKRKAEADEQAGEV